MNNFEFPRQVMSYKSKNKAWRKKHLEWAANKAVFTNESVRNSVIHKKINYDLILGKLHMEDLQSFVNPDNVDASFIPEKITHYPIINTKLEVLNGEESKRIYDWRVVITNPNAVSDIERTKKQQVLQSLEQIIQDTSASEEEFNSRLEQISDYYTYEYQDIREIRANALLNHYMKELNLPLLFNEGFKDAEIVGEELYLVDIVSGEPYVEKLNPLEVRAYRTSNSCDIEDADIVVIEQYWSPGKIIDYYHEYLSDKDVKYIETGTSKQIGEGSFEDERQGMASVHMVDDAIYTNGNNGFTFSAEGLFDTEVENSLLPFDLEGNVRVIRMYWKTKRAILKVKSYDPMTGEEIYTLMSEDYVVNEDRGEEAQKFWINQAWGGVLIGDTKDGVYIKMGPREIQYNRMSNPSRCHFGIIGSYYNVNNNKPYSLVDRMKPFNYMYDVIHDRLNKTLASNWGSILEVDLAKVPTGWEIDKWLYFAKVNHIAVVDSFKEGTKGAATGKLAGGMNNASRGIIDSNIGNYIQQQINLLEYIKSEMAEVAGISPQREGQVSNRETVGGVERATLQSSHITEWIFFKHDDVKRRVMECVLETAKICLRGRSKKFQYVLPDFTLGTIEIDGDEFAECDYGLLVDNSSSTQKLASQLESLAQAALQTQTLSFSAITKLYGSISLAEKQRIIEKSEREIQQRQQEAQQQQLQSQQQIAQMQSQDKQAELQLKDMLNQRDNETQILLKTMELQDAEGDGIVEVDPSKKEELAAKIKEMDRRFQLDSDKFDFEKQTKKEELRLKEKQINKSRASK